MGRAIVRNPKAVSYTHLATIFDHPYASPWYSWLFDWKPLLDSREYLAGDKVSVIATFGNPVLYFAGLYACLLYTSIIVAFFILGMFYFMYAFVVSEKRRYLLLAGLFTGLGCATKWTGIYASVSYTHLDNGRDLKSAGREGTYRSIL